MEKEDLFECFGSLDDDLLKRSECGGEKMRKGIYFSGFLKYAGIAACLAAVLGIGLLSMDNESPNPVFVVPESYHVAESDDSTSDEQADLQDKSERYVNISMLLASDEAIEVQNLEIAAVEIKNDSAQYYKVASVESDILRESIGGDVPGTQKWHKVSGHEDMQYLISSEKEECSLWKFESFQKESYPYSDVLQTIYNIRSAEDITAIIVAPATMDNSDMGKELQAKIGTSIVTDDEAIETVYNVLSGLTCYGGNHWDMIGLGEDTPSAMQSQVRSGRYLTLATSQGMAIDTLKYTGISGMFYEYGGIAYSALTMEEKTAVEKILKIESIDEPSDSSTEESETQNETGEDSENNSRPAASDTTQDAPANAETYQQAREYSAELTDLQNRISEAMMNNELPFVTSSGIYENPDRVLVRVNTTDEDLIGKLRAFDTTGKLLEIEYTEHAAVLE